MTTSQPSFAVFRAPVDRTVFEPGFRLWLRVSGPLARFRWALLRLPDRGRSADPNDPPPEYFRYPPI